MELRFRATTVEAQPYLGIRTEAPRDSLSATMGSLFGEVSAHLQRSGKAPAGMPFTIYYWMNRSTVGFLCGIPVAERMRGAGRIWFGMLPEGAVATVTHLGPYDELENTWSALEEWIKDQGCKPAAAPWEVYVTDPGAEPDSSKWRTDLFLPIVVPRWYTAHRR